MKNQKYFSFAIILIGLVACNSNKQEFDATGVFEAEEIVVSSEIGGKLLSFNISEGDVLKAGQEVAQIDCQQVNLQKLQVQASISAMKLRENSADPQIKILRSQVESQKTLMVAQKQQLDVLEKERQRFQKLVNAEAAPAKQLDDLVGQIDVLKKQIEGTQSQISVLNAQMEAQKEQISIQNRGVLSETQPLQMRIAQIEDQLGRCKVINPKNGTVLVKYANAQEVTGAGKPLYKLADLETMTLRAYISGTQLGRVKVNQPVTVFIDNGKDSYKEMQGIVSWISSKSEFTPKTIQTKDERENLVYAVKIKVKNDGFIKIGMYGEVQINASKP